MVVVVGSGCVVVPYLVGKLSQPVRLQQQRGVEEEEEEEGGGDITTYAICGRG